MRLFNKNTLFRLALAALIPVSHAFELDRAIGKKP
jgi:hypothetical protein